jgi:hypothetical protein
MKMKEDIKILMDKYFEGTTTCEEERQLRSFFATDEVPDEWAVYKPIFACLDEERQKVMTVQHTARRRPLYLHYLWGSIAAAILIVLGIAGYDYLSQQDTNYVIINGEKSTDIRLARQQAQKAFAEVSFSKEDVSDDLFSDMKGEEP